MLCVKKVDISRMEIIALCIIIIGYLLELQIAFYTFKEEQIAQKNEKEEIEKIIAYYKERYKCL